MIEHLFGSHKESFEKLSKWLNIGRTGLETFIERLTLADTATKKREHSDRNKSWIWSYN